MSHYKDWCVCQVHRKRPGSRLTLHYDKLHADNAVYVYNEDTDSIELLNVAEIQAEYENQVSKNFIKKTL